ncbi:PadR family transcriptional regulator [Streptomyces sp. I05A-00742]|uniref:PadR family transcriptional regulator n=1 Tax=Streptomyces sp. I05A-00742 TaxID=2732853 RepID=UPI00289AC25F|nr:PadR family transcriptional regulator [Streptomyces sp. I05A-00742]
MAARRKLSNPLALAVLVTLVERPMHPYEIARVLRLRGKDQSIKINYGSLYTVVQNLEKHGFVEEAGTDRRGNRPERTLYGLTPGGRLEMHDWLADLVSVPAREYPLFETALSLIMALPYDEACELLDDRIAVREGEVAGHRGSLRGFEGVLPRLLLVETEFRLHMLEAELTWLRGFRADLGRGAVGGVAEWRELSETGRMPETLRELEERAGENTE